MHLYRLKLENRVLQMKLIQVHSSDHVASKPHTLLINQLQSSRDCYQPIAGTLASLPTLCKSHPAATAILNIDNQTFITDLLYFLLLQDMLLSD